MTVELYKDYYINPGEYSNLYQTNFALRDLAKIFAYENQFGGCLLLNQGKYLVETTHGTLFLISAGTIKTPDLSSGTVNTVLRSKFIEQIKLEKSLQFEETNIASFSLQKADEIFTLSLSSGFNNIRQFRKKVYETERSNALFDLIKESTLKSVLVRVFWAICPNQSLAAKCYHLVFPKIIRVYFEDF